MKRLHLHIPVYNIASNVAFYTALIGVVPVVRKPDYVNWTGTGSSTSRASCGGGSPGAKDGVARVRRRETEDAWTSPARARTADPLELPGDVRQRMRALVF